MKDVMHWKDQKGNEWWEPMPDSVVPRWQLPVAFALGIVLGWLIGRAW